MKHTVISKIGQLLAFKSSIQKAKGCLQFTCEGTAFLYGFVCASTVTFSSTPPSTCKNTHEKVTHF